MNRRTFLSRLLVGLLAAPVIAKVISEPRPVRLYFDGTNDYLKTTPFKLQAPQTIYYVFDKAHTMDEQDQVVKWMVACAPYPCPLPGLVMRPAPSC